MLNKKKIIAIAIIVAIVLLVIAIVIAKINSTSKVTQIYNKLVKSNEYVFEMKDTSGYEITIAKKNGQTCIDMNNEGERITTLVKGDTTYLISHSQKKYYEYNSDISGENAIVEMLNLEKTNYTKGKGKVNDKKYKYEEYLGFSGFTTSTNIEEDTDNAKTRFYFDGNDIKYIETLPKEGDSELLEVSISYEAPDELFEIPSDYTEREE